MLVARLTKNSVCVEIRLDNDYKTDCASDLARLDTFLDKVSLDVAVALVNKEIKATASDVNDAIFGEMVGRKGLRVSLYQSSLGVNKDKIAEDHMEAHPSVGNGVLRDKNTGKMYINGKLMSGSLEKVFTPKGVVNRVKDLIKSKLGLECGKWVRVDCTGYDVVIEKDGVIVEL